MPVTFYNTLSRQQEEFVPTQQGEATVYTCGPTVYHFAHIGNLRTYIFEDTLVKMLRQQGYNVRHAMNITDVGHLQSDADSGDDKMSVAAAREQKTPWEIAEFYQGAFFQDCEKLSIDRPDIVCKATDHIPQMIEMISQLEEKGFTYTVDGNVYFEVSKFPTYRDLGRLAEPDQSTVSRVEGDSRKRDQRDFVLWFSQSKYPHQIMKWDSPWGEGFPGWHIECSAMAMQYLGDTIDIHCGGVDHIPVHHSNEVAQAEAVLGHKWVNYWLHGEFLNLDREKMSKSSGSFITLEGLIQAGFEPVHYRFFCLNAHYRTNLKFNYDVLENARKDFETIKCRIVSWQYESVADEAVVLSTEDEAKLAEYQQQFWEAISQDLNTPKALFVFRKLVKDNSLPNTVKLSVLREFDVVLGLGVDRFVRHELTAAQAALLQTRSEAREARDYEASDRIRGEFLQQGIHLEDARDGTVQWYLVRQPRLPSEAPDEVSEAEVVLEDAAEEGKVAALPTRGRLFTPANAVDQQEEEQAVAVAAAEGAESQGTSASLAL